MGTLEDVEGRVSYEATRLGYRVWVSGQGRQIQQGFHPKRGAAVASSVCLGGPAGFLWLRWGISSTVLTWHGFVCVLEGPRCDRKRAPATPLGDFNWNMQPHTGPTRVLVGLFGFVTVL